MIIIGTSNARPTSTGVDNGVDVNVTLIVDGVEHRGEVTLTPAQDGRPTFEAYGSDPSMWVSGALWGIIRDLPDYRSVLSGIEARAAETARG